jgi:hypothetical protein
MGTNLIVRALEIGLFLGIILHVVQGLVFVQPEQSQATC